ncbi:hypothetical protein LMG10661_00784 [Ralstonia syzygii subsp. syzygii]|nr:hypothetical protein LMG10661_00784 [Ralstonia syzygii subsp. syzygii]
MGGWAVAAVWFGVGTAGLVGVQADFVVKMLLWFGIGWSANALRRPADQVLSRPAVRLWLLRATVAVAVWFTVLMLGVLPSYPQVPGSGALLRIWFLATVLAVWAAWGGLNWFREHVWKKEGQRNGYPPEWPKS